MHGFNQNLREERGWKGEVGWERERVRVRDKGEGGRARETERERSTCPRKGVIQLCEHLAPIVTRYQSSCVCMWVGVGYVKTRQFV